MTKVHLKLTAKELFKIHMGIDIPVSKITLMECSTDTVNVSYDEQHERVNYLWFSVGNRHYVYTDRLYKSFAMFPDDTLTDGIELMK
ncbi:MAG: hypothetical protein J6R22_00160 [Alphaproteobacteria bacterium]|nr:hypothetical protein [Alphaproteobacteria bacterium]